MEWVPVLCIAILVKSPHCQHVLEQMTTLLDSLFNTVTLHVSLCLRLPATWLLVQQFDQVYSKENIKAEHYRPFLRGIHQWLMDPPHKGPVSDVEIISSCDMMPSCLVHKINGLVQDCSISNADGLAQDCSISIVNAL